MTNLLYRDNLDEAPIASSRNAPPTVQALPHQNAPVAASLCQSACGAVEPLWQAAETVVLASREKLGAASPFVVLPLSEVDTLVIEGGLPEELIGSYRRSALTLVET
jgi:hypothetical protein